MSSTSNPHLLTRDEVLAALRREREKDGLTVVARRYKISPQQLCDCLQGRASLSKRMVKRLKYRLRELYEKVEDRADAE